MSDAEEPLTYAIRFYERANRDIDAIVVFLADNFGQRVARLWYGELGKAIASLSHLPERYAIATEPHFTQTTRNLTWARPGSRISHRILYRVFHEGVDGAVVYILHVRGATRAPITVAEAREIEAQQ